MYTQDVLKQCDKQLCLQEQERRQSLFYGSEFIDKYFDKTNVGSYHYDQVIRYSKRAPDGDIFKSKYIFFLIHNSAHFELAVVFVEDDDEADALAVVSAPAIGAPAMLIALVDPN